MTSERNLVPVQHPEQIGVLHTLAGEQKRFLKRWSTRTYSENLKPENAQLTVSEIEGAFGQDEPIFYKRDSQLRSLIGISHATLSYILSLARTSEVISRPQFLDRGYFYNRAEIVKAFEFFFRSRGEGESLLGEARRLRKERKEKDARKLTIREAADRLGVPATVFYRWTIKGQVDLGSEVLAESLKRFKSDDVKDIRVIDQTIFEDERIFALKSIYERHKIESSSYNTKIRNYPADFPNVSSVYRDVFGQNPSPRLMAKIVRLFVDCQIDVHGSRAATRGTYWNVSKEEVARAKEVLEDHRDELEPKNKVYQICGGAVENMPTAYDVREKRCLALKPLMKEAGLSAIGWGRQEISDYFGRSGSVDIFGYGKRVFVPASQKEKVCDFVRNNPVAFEN